LNGSLLSSVPLALPFQALLINHVIPQLIAFEITIVLLREGFAIRAEYAEAREKEEALKKGLSLQ
jgi:hypothetical protein